MQCSMDISVCEENNCQYERRDGWHKVEACLTASVSFVTGDRELDFPFIVCHLSLLLKACQILRWWPKHEGKISNPFLIIVFVSVAFEPDYFVTNWHFTRNSMLPVIKRRTRRFPSTNLIALEIKQGKGGYFRCWMLFLSLIKFEMVHVRPVEDSDSSDLPLWVEFNCFQIDVILGFVAKDRRLNTVSKYQLKLWQTIIVLPVF